jgi:hypothetical protein
MGKFQFPIGYLLEYHFRLQRVVYKPRNMLIGIILGNYGLGKLIMFCFQGKLIDYFMSSFCQIKQILTQK